MKFPEKATKAQKRLIRELWIENVTRSITDHEKRVIDMEQTIKNYRKAIRETKKHIANYKAELTDAQNTVI